MSPIWWVCGRWPVRWPRLMGLLLMLFSHYAYTFRPSFRCNHGTLRLSQSMRRPICTPRLSTPPGSFLEEGLLDRLLHHLHERQSKTSDTLTEAERVKLRQVETLIQDLLREEEENKDGEGRAHMSGNSVMAERTKEKITYTAAGVDVEKGDRFVDIVKHVAKASWRPGCVGSIGGFGALFNLSAASVPPDALLVASTDGVGTKVLLARDLEDYETIGYDLVAMSANDVLTLGAQPLFFLDYMGWPKLDLKNATSTLQGIADGCRASGCALIGGETAELPGVYLADGGRDLAGFVVGAVRPSDLLPQQALLCAGDVIVGLPSNGLHANGLSLVRRLVQDDPGLDYEGPAPFDRSSGKTLRQAIMQPTRIYVPSLLPILQKRPGLIKAMAHITGGGLTGNLPRVLPQGLQAELDWSAWTWPPIFQWIQEKAGLSRDEMAGVFNCGMGMCVIVGAGQDQDLMIQELRALGVQGVAVIGTLTPTAVEQR